MNAKLKKLFEIIFGGKNCIAVKSSAIESIAKRFAGADFQYRSQISMDWPKHWRIKMVVSKNERSEYRIVEFGDDLESLANKVLEKLK